MSESEKEPLTRSDRKALLILACNADRLAWRQACLSSASNSIVSQMTRKAIHWADLASAFLPGRLGRWARGASFLSHIASTLGWLRF